MKNYNNGFSNNVGLFKLAEKTKVNRNFIWFTLLIVLVTIIAATPAGIIAVFVNDPVLEMFINLAGGFGLTSLMVFAIVKYREKRPVADLGFQKSNALNLYVKGFLYGLAMMGLCTGIMFAFGGLKLVPNVESVGLHMLPSILFLLIGWIIQGGTEEVLYRGWMMPLLGKKYNVPFAIIVSSVGFTLLHSGNNGMTIMPIINLTLYGAFAALYVVNEKSLWGICGWHSAWNWMQGNILGVEVSGTNVPGGSLIKLTAQGNPLISGDVFGIEGSIVCTVVLGVSCVYLINVLIQQKHKTGEHSE